jgi:hypothetical protein
MSSLPLIDYAESKARASDPVTSRLAAKNIQPKLSNLHRQFLNKLLELGQATSNEVAMSISNEHARINSLRRRASDLVEDGLVREVGHRVCSRTNNRATVYEVVQ